MVSVLELLEGVRVDRLPGWAKEDADAMFARFGSFLRHRRSCGRTAMRSSSIFCRENDFSSKKGIRLEIVRWENYLERNVGDALTG